ncbi:MAG: prolipoprotein diacylglyceryl transferase [Anaerolineales bacterium]|jgi:phosphatidylglycerol:prolipoprotein diacylglycerol transferase
MAIDHYGIHIGILYIRFYGLILMSGALGASYLTYFQAQRKGEDGEIVWDALIWVLIAGIIGARIWHILTPPPSMIAQGITTEYYLTHPLDALAIWNGGLGIVGAVAGGILALFIYLRSKHASFTVWADLVAPGLALGQAIGRWGNFINEELYGGPSNLPWAIYIDPQNRLPAFRDVAYYHPLFLYESIWDLANMFFLLWLGRRFANRLKAGDVFLVYLIIYPIGRFLLEFVRLDSSMVAGINANQYLMLVVILLSALALYLRHRHTPAARDTGESEGAAFKEEMP